MQPEPLQKICVIVNCFSGTAKDSEIPERVEALFKKYNLRADFHFLDSPKKLTPTISEAIKKRYHAIVVGGGDGTISTAAELLAEKNIPLGLLPLGTLNHFTKDLNIPQELEKSVEIIKEGFTRKVDVACVNGHLFLNNSSLGLYPEIVRLREKGQKLGLGKWPAFFRAMLQSLKRYPFLNVHLKVDGKPMVRKTPIVFIGNNLYEIHGTDLGTRSTLTEGKLSLLVTHKTGRLRLIILAFRALLGKLADAKDFDALAATEIVIQSSHKVLRVSKDGEVLMMKPPLRYSIFPQSLQVIVPKEQPAEDSQAKKKEESAS